MRKIFDKYLNDVKTNNKNSVIYKMKKILSSILVALLIMVTFNVVFMFSNSTISADATTTQTKVEKRKELNVNAY